LIARKREIFSNYREALAHFPGLSLNPEPAGMLNGAWMPTIVLAPVMAISREMLMRAFSAENIDARVFFHPLSSLPMFAPQVENINAWSIPGRAINLPSYHEIGAQDMARVTSVIHGLLNPATR
jgi:perosamine synthetase